MYHWGQASISNLESSQVRSLSPVSQHAKYLRYVLTVHMEISDKRKESLWPRLKWQHWNELSDEITSITLFNLQD